MAHETVFINASVVFLVKDNSPGMYTHDFLEHHEVIPKEYRRLEAVSLPILSQIKYPGGYVFEATEERTKIEIVYPKEPSVASMKQHGDIIREIATTLVKQTAYLNYHALGINFRVRTKGTLDTLANLGALPETAEVTQIKFRVGFLDFTNTVTMSTGIHSVSGEEILVIDSNYHLPIEPDSKEERMQAIMAALGQRQQCLNNFIEIIDGNGS